MNRLASESSPYLRAAATQPVEWLPWGAEAFERAEREDKPILLDVGAVWCHWCHVMDHESYEDPEIAALIRERFVPVKVDRDERPDVDVRYQKAVQALAAQGGWPLTAFLTPEGRCFYGGTYFPPQETHGRPSFRAVLVAVSDFWRDHRDKALDQAARLAGALAPRLAGKGAVAPEVVAEGERAVLAAFDPASGGFGRAPKFPHPGALDFALRRAVRSGSATLLDVVNTTLGGMAQGGVHDRVGGGFHRYSVDAEWRIPHFEKMLHDNAELLRVYARAHAATGDARFADVARGIVRFLDEVLRVPEGGFGGSQDADVGREDDGSYFTWTKAEVEAALPPEVARVAALAWGIREGGNFHGRTVLFEEADAASIAAALGRPEEDVRATLEEARRGLAALRAGREAPFADPSVYVGWNGLAIAALFEASAALELPRARVIALAALDRILAEAVDAERGAAHRLGPGGASGHGLLDDNAQLAWACTEAFVHTGERRFLDAARRLADLLDRDFRHPEGAYADTAAWARAAAPVEALVEPDRPVGDQPSASPNAVAAMTHLRLALLTGDEASRRRADEVLAALAPEARRYGFFAGTFLHAADLLLDPPPHATVAGDGEALLAAALAAYAPGKAVVRAVPGAAVPPEVRGMLEAAGDAPAVFVCRAGACAPPARGTDQVPALVGKG